MKRVSLIRPFTLLATLLLVLSGCSFVSNISKVSTNINSRPTQLHSESATPPLWPGHLAENTSTWKTYRDGQYGFEFKYPPSWGDVKVTKGIRSTIKSGSCYDGGEPGIPKFGPAFSLYDQSLSFSSAPFDVSFSISEVDELHPFLSDCDKRLNLFKIAQNNAAEPPSFSQNDIKNIYGWELDWTTEFYGTSQNDGKMLVIDPFAMYQFVAGSQEEAAVEKYECNSGQNDSTIKCGDVEAWFYESIDAAKIREAFITFGQVSSSFKFDKPVTNI